MASSKPNREISRAGLALRYALACEPGHRLRIAALTWVTEIIQREGGQAGAIADALDIDRRTYSRLRADFPVLARAHEKARKLLQKEKT